MIGAKQIECPHISWISYEITEFINNGFPVTIRTQIFLIIGRGVPVIRISCRRSLIKTFTLKQTFVCTLHWRIVRNIIKIIPCIMGISHGIMGTPHGISNVVPDIIRSPILVNRPQPQRIAKGIGISLNIHVWILPLSLFKKRVRPQVAAHPGIIPAMVIIHQLGVNIKPLTHKSHGNPNGAGGGGANTYLTSGDQAIHLTIINRHGYTALHSAYSV